MRKKPIEPLVKRRRFSLDPERAFALFTEEMGSWWPLGSYSVAGEEAAEAVFEGWQGGAIFERTRDGTTHVWGTVLEWEPPFRLAFSWHPGRTPSTAQRVELVFEADGDGCRLTLIHSGWDALGDEAEGTRTGYESGWDFVLTACYAAAALRRYPPPGA